MGIGEDLSMNDGGILKWQVGAVTAPVFLMIGFGGPIASLIAKISGSSRDCADIALLGLTFVGIAAGVSTWRVRVSPVRRAALVLLWLLPLFVLQCTLLVYGLRWSEFAANLVQQGRSISAIFFAFSFLLGAVPVYIARPREADDSKSGESD